MKHKTATYLEVQIELYLRERENNTIEIPLSIEKDSTKRYINIKEASNEDLYLYLEYINDLSNQELPW